MKKQENLPLFDLYTLPIITDAETLIAGVDEVGRGCLFGPVVAAAVVLPISQISRLTTIGVNDSKQLSSKKRSELVSQIKQIATAYHISFATVQEIDEINILQASLLAMQRAILKLQVSPSLCLVDGKQSIPNLSILQQTVIKGDQRSPLIAAASILAKVWRDHLIIRLANKYPQYDLANNKGYGTKKHLQALLKYGASPQHRLSFRPCHVNFNHE